MNDQFILGFIAGEGCFDTHICESQHGTVGVSSRFKVEVNDVDLSLLEQFSDYWNIGKVRSRSGRKLCGWMIENKNDLEKLIEIIESNIEHFKETNKYESYEKWKPIAETYIDGRGMTEKEKIWCVRQSKRTNPNGYTGETAEYWVEKIKDE